MSTVTVRHLDPEVQKRLKLRAARNGRSMEAEARAILSAAVASDDLASDWLRMSEGFRGDDLPLPERSAPRDVDVDVT
ncbi:TraY domain-containing protein [Cellulomonas algicola]|uniref:FitA-like ribbon-helix-helix domain-containing protein n=1 Tax=Cellulomonas algicola TaxID=2071633 RepID=UPI001C3FB8D7|nr:TraY domain-containing protein [Cellulomonas algicola]